MSPAVKYRNTAAGGFTDIGDPKSTASRESPKPSCWKTIKRALILGMAFFVVVVVLLIVILPLLFTCTIFPNRGACCKDNCESDTCEFRAEDIKTDGQVFELKASGGCRCKSSRYYFTRDDNSLKVSDSGETPDKSLEDESVALGDNSIKFLEWLPAKTVRTNDSWLVEFRDQGTRFMGLGSFDTGSFRPREDVSYNIWATAESPYYLPVYISHGTGGAACLVINNSYGYITADVSKDGKVSFRIYDKTPEFRFFVGKNLIDVLKGCYPFYNKAGVDPKFKGDVIGSGVDVKTVNENSNKELIFTKLHIPASNLEFKDTSTMEIKGDGSVLSNKYTYVLGIPAGITISIKTIAAEEKKDFLLLADDGGYYANFEAFNAGAFDSEYEYVLEGGYEAPRLAKTEDLEMCPEVPIEDANSLGVPFAGGTVFSERHRYDEIRRSAIGKNTVIPESFATTSTKNMYRTNLKGMDGLKRCYHELVSSQLLGVRGFSCNLGNGNKDAPSAEYELWGILAFLMPTVSIISNSEFIDFNGDSEPGRHLQTSFNFKNEWLQVLNEELKHAIADNHPFIVPISLLGGNNEAVFVGKNLLFVPPLSLTAAELRITFPEDIFSTKELKDELYFINVKSGNRYKQGGTWAPDIISVNSLLFMVLRESVGASFILQDPDKKDMYVIHFCSAVDFDYVQLQTHDIVTSDGSSFSVEVQIPDSRMVAKINGVGTFTNKGQISKVFVHYIQINAKINIGSITVKDKGAEYKTIEYDITSKAFYLSNKNQEITFATGDGN